MFNSSKKIISRLLVLGSLITFSYPMHAAPDLQRVTKIDGVTIIGDHEDSRIYYYLKSEKRLSERDGAPDFRYSVNRYIGKKLTGDEDAFWVRGVIKFSAESHFQNTDLQRISDQLASRESHSVVLKSAPILDSYNTLVYATIAQNESEPFAGELSGGETTEFESDNEDDQALGQRVFGAQMQRFTIGLSGNDANLFWENFERNNLSLSLAYGWRINGVIKDQSDAWVPSSYQVSNSLPIQVSFEQYPQLFSKNELWQRVNFAHTGIKVMCYDFINLNNTDLYYVNVELRFMTLRGQHYTREVKFRADSDIYEQDIEFALANDTKDGYEFRIRRMTNEGEMIRTDWQSGTEAWLDVSLSGAELTEMEKATHEELEL